MNENVQAPTTTPEVVVPNKKSNNVIIVLLVVIVLALAGFVVYQNIKSESKPTDQKSPDNSTVEQPATTLPSDTTPPTGETVPSTTQPVPTVPTQPEATTQGNTINIDADLKSIDSLDPTNVDKNYEDGSMSDL